jgi:thiol-disulfide isomerase/thioredoxin
MKHIYMLFIALTLGLTAQSQLPDGSIAPNFTATDINGVEWNLYELLDAGNTVILDFYATWCGPCWSYAQDGTLEEIYSTFGPDGTGDVYVFALESDDSTTAADLDGTGGNTTGDWVSLLNMPIIDNAASIFNSYACTYYPTIYTVCPDYTLVESGQASFDGHMTAAFAPCGNTISGAAPMLSYNGDTSSCGGGEWSASTSVDNLGSEAVTAMTFEVSLNGAGQPDVMWTGALSNGASETIDLGSYSTVGTLDYKLVSVNGESWDAGGIVDIVSSTESNTYIQVRITTDQWPQETGWEITNASGAFVAGEPIGSLAGQIDTELFWNVALDMNECYVFTLLDDFGDGLYASQWGNYVDGSASIVSMDGTNDMGIVWSYEGSSGIMFEEIVAGMEVTSTSASISENDLTSSVSVFPNPFSDNTSLTFTTVEAGNASVVVYNLVGQKVIEMNLGNITAGTQRIELDFASTEVGIYLVSLTAGGETSTLRVTSTH